MTFPSRGSWLAAILIFLTSWAAPPARAQGSESVTLLLSESGPAYQEVADAFMAALGGRFPAKVVLLDGRSQVDLNRLDARGSLIVPVGIKAMRQVYALHVAHASVLSLLVPRSAALAMLGSTGLAGHESAVYIDQPISRSLAFIHLLLPEAERVGLILSNDTSGDIAGYRQLAARSRINLVVETVSDSRDVPSALQHIMPKVDAFLLMADAKVVNESTVRYLLLANYREEIPVIGFSRGLTNAGAVASVVSDPDSIGRQGGKLAREWDPETGALPGPAYPTEFALVFNRQVTRSLNVAYPEDSQELAHWRETLD